MVKHTQTIPRQFADELFEFDHFVGLALRGLKYAFSFPQMLVNRGTYVAVIIVKSLKNIFCVLFFKRMIGTV